MKRILLVSIFLTSLVLLTLISGCRFAEVEQAVDNVRLIEFSHPDLKLCYSDAFRDIDPKSIVNHDYTQMAKNFEHAIKLKYPSYFSSDTKSKQAIYKELDLEGKKELLKALGGIACNYVIQGPVHIQEAFNTLEPIYQVLSSEDIRSFPEITVASGFIKGKQGEYSAAIDRFSKIIGSGKNGVRYAEVLYGRALSYYKEWCNKHNENLLKKTNQDLTALIESKSFAGFPFKLEVYWKLGNSLLKELDAINSEESRHSNDLKDAIKAFNHAVTTDTPSYHLADAYDGLGSAYMMQGDYDKAIDSFKQALTSISYPCTSPQIYLHLGKAYIQKKQFFEGANLCLLAKKISPNDSIKAEAMKCVGDYYINLGNEVDRSLESEAQKLKEEECTKETNTHT